MYYLNLHGISLRIVAAQRDRRTDDSAGVPKTWTVGDKTGRCGNGATNDVAIIRPPGRAPIVVAIYSIGSTSSADDRAATVAEAARAVVEFLSQQ
jgi:beta-lactamase class A